MGKITYMEIVGKNYPMSFSLMATKKIAEKYGSLEKALNKAKGETTPESIETLTDIVELLISQGCAFKNYFEKDVPAPENAPIINGKWEPLPREALDIAITLADMNELTDKIYECIGMGKQKEVEVQDTEKNAETAPE